MEVRALKSQWLDLFKQKKKENWLWGCLKYGYEASVHGEEIRKPFPVDKDWRATECLELIHANLCRPLCIESIGGRKYRLLFINDFSHVSWVYFLELKSEILENFKKFKLVVEKQSGNILKLFVNSVK